MAKYQKYAEYKDSGVEWLGKIPSHWNSKSLKYLCTYNDDVLSETISKDTEIQYVDIGSVSAVYGISHIETMTFNDAPSRARRIVKDGDVIVSTVRTYLEAIAPIENPPKNLIVSTGFSVIRPSQYLNKCFAAYCLKAKGFIKEVVARSVGVSYPAINSSELVNIIIPSVPYLEQTQIANFLDHETAKIDTLIAKQEKLIELLKEKRQAVISHAVTKGLNPNVKMKASGIEWLGDVPEHWSVTKIGFHTLKIGSGKTPKGGAEIYQDQGILFIRSQNIYNDGLRIDISENTYISEAIHDDMSNSKVYSGDILLNITGGSIGRSSLVPDEFPEANVNQHVCIIRVRNYLQDFLALVIQSDLIQAQIQSIQTGGNREGLNFEQISNFYFALPSIEEQELLFKYIQCKVFEYRELEAKANTAIQLMQERRTALISAAVTGKIDVRHWKNPNKNNNQENMECST
ncbi:restriction endonuclease subunit S [Acinetobacter nectaris]|nr:restriction endonuclease subunit S [Acinetobacter nectaris]